MKSWVVILIVALVLVAGFMIVNHKNADLSPKKASTESSSQKIVADQKPIVQERPATDLISAANQQQTTPASGLGLIVANQGVGPTTGLFLIARPSTSKSAGSFANYILKNGN